MNFSSNEILAIIAALSALIVALGTATATIILAVRQGAAVKENTALTHEMSAKTDVIVGHVNSKATADAAKIESLTQQIAVLKGVAADNKEIAALLAQSVSDKRESKLPAAAAPVEVEIVNKPDEPVPVREESNKRKP